MSSSESQVPRGSSDRAAAGGAVSPSEPPLDGSQSPKTTAVAAAILDPADLTAGQVDGYRKLALGQLEFTRRYTLELLEQVDPTDWWVTPPGMTSCIAWQVGHLAVSQYGLMLFRQRGRAAGDLELMPGWLRKRFGRGSVPPSEPDPAIDPQRLLAILASIDQAARQAVAGQSIESLMEPAEMPYAVLPTKLGAILFCPLHESLHSGQIGLIRRGLGLPPVR
jgi:hypothetical protein